MSNSEMVQLLSRLTADGQSGQASLIKQESEVLAKFIRQHKVDRNPANSPLIQKLTELIIGLVSVKNSPFINESVIVLLNNLFNLNAGLLPQIIVNYALVRNLREYCVEFFKKYEGEECKGSPEGDTTRRYFNLYSTVYLLAVFASYKPVSDQQTAGARKLLHRQVVRQFLSLEIVERSKPELFLLFSVVMVKVAKPSLGSTLLHLLKRFMVPHLSLLPDNEKVQFNYTLCLRMLLVANVVTLSEIKRHNVLEFLVVGINSNRCHLVYALDSIRMVLMNHPHLGLNCVRMGLLELLKQTYPSQPALVARVLEKLVAFTTATETHELCCLFQRKVREGTHREDALRCFSMLIQYQSAQHLLQMLENGLLDNLEILAQNNKEPATVGLVLNTLQVIASMSRIKLPHLYSCVVAKIGGGLLIQTAFEIGFETKVLAQRLIQKHLLL